MAVPRFLFGGEFSEGLLNFRKIEQWIVSEAVPTSGLPGNTAARHASESPFQAAIARQGDDTHELRRAISNSIQVLQQQSVVGRIRGALARIARRVDARRSAQRRYL